jgi:hypothetical protein
MSSGAKPRLISMPFQWLRGCQFPGPSRRCRADRIFGHGQIVQAVRRADFVRGGPAFERGPRRHRRGFEIVTGGLLKGTKKETGGAGLDGCGLKGFAVAGLVQFSADETGVSGSLMTSAGGGVVVGCDAQPARKISVPQKMIPANLNTRQLCGTGRRTQDVSSQSFSSSSSFSQSNRSRTRTGTRRIFGLHAACRRRELQPSFVKVKILVAITGASGALYAQRLLDNLDPRQHEIHVVQSNYAQQVIAEELPGGLKLPAA